MGSALEIAHLLGGAMLVLALLLLAQRRSEAVIEAYALQSVALALAAAAQGWARGEAALFVVAIVVLGLQAVVIPAGLRRVARETSQLDGGSPAAMALGVVVVVLGILALRGATLPGGVAREDLAAALSVMALGVLVVITRRDALGQMLGFLSAASGCTLAAVSMPGLAGPVILLGMALLAIPAVGVLIVRRA